MPYLNDVPICDDYKYNFEKMRWYCDYFKRWQDSRLDCKNCPYCKVKKENQNCYDTY